MSSINKKIKKDSFCSVKSMELILNNLIKSKAKSQKFNIICLSFSDGSGKHDYIELFEIMLGQMKEFLEFMGCDTLYIMFMMKVFIKAVAFSGGGDSYIFESLLLMKMGLFLVDFTCKKSVEEVVLLTMLQELIYFNNFSLTKFTWVSIQWSFAMTCVISNNSTGYQVPSELLLMASNSSLSNLPKYVNLSTEYSEFCTGMLNFYLDDSLEGGLNFLSVNSVLNNSVVFFFPSECFDDCYDYYFYKEMGGISLTPHSLVFSGIFDICSIYYGIKAFFKVLSKYNSTSKNEMWVLNSSSLINFKDLKLSIEGVLMLGDGKWVLKGCSLKQVGYNVQTKHKEIKTSKNLSNPSDTVFLMLESGSEVFNSFFIGGEKPMLGDSTLLDTGINSSFKQDDEDSFFGINFKDKQFLVKKSFGDLSILMYFKYNFKHCSMQCLSFKYPSSEEGLGVLGPSSSEKLVKMEGALVGEDDESQQQKVNGILMLEDLYNDYLEYCENDCFDVSKTNKSMESQNKNLKQAVSKKFVESTLDYLAELSESGEEGSSLSIYVCDGETLKSNCFCEKMGLSSVANCQGPCLSSSPFSWGMDKGLVKSKFYKEILSLPKPIFFKTDSNLVVKEVNSGLSSLLTSVIYEKVGSMVKLYPEKGVDIEDFDNMEAVVNSIKNKSAKQSKKVSSLNLSKINSTLTEISKGGLKFTTMMDMSKMVSGEIGNKFDIVLKKGKDSGTGISNSWYFMDLEDLDKMSLNSFKLSLMNYDYNNLKTGFEDKWCSEVFKDFSSGEIINSVTIKKDFSSIMEKVSKAKSKVYKTLEGLFEEVMTSLYKDQFVSSTNMEGFSTDLKEMYLETVKNSLKSNNIVCNGVSNGSSTELDSGSKALKLDYLQEMSTYKMPVDLGEFNAKDFLSNKNNEDEDSDGEEDFSEIYGSFGALEVEEMKSQKPKKEVIKDGQTKSFKDFVEMCSYFKWFDGGSFDNLTETTLGIWGDSSLIKQKNQKFMEFNLQAFSDKVSEVVGKSGDSNN